MSEKKSLMVSTSALGSCLTVVLFNPQSTRNRQITICVSGAIAVPCPCGEADRLEAGDDCIRFQGNQSKDQLRSLKLKFSRIVIPGKERPYFVKPKRLGFGDEQGCSSIVKCGFGIGLFARILLSHYSPFRTHNAEPFLLQKFESTN